VAGASAIAWRALADSRVRTISFALLFILSALTQATAYREGYPTLADRLDFARSVGEKPTRSESPPPSASSSLVNHWRRSVSCL
jgi:hypothetical protein